MPNSSANMYLKLVLTKDKIYVMVFQFLESIKYISKQRKYFYLKEHLDNFYYIY